MTRVRAGLSNITANIGFNNYTTPQGYKVGKVYAVILNEQSVPQQVWIDNGGWAGVGTVLYAEYREDTELPLESLNDQQLSELDSSVIDLYLTKDQIQDILIFCFFLRLCFFSYFID